MKKRERVLNSPDKQIGQATGLLAAIWRQILRECKVDDEKFDMLMQQWINNPRNRIPNDAKKRSSARGNLAKEMFRDDMTWRVFLKGIRFLNPRSIRFHVTLDWGHRNYTTVEHRVNVQDINLDAEGYDLPPPPEEEGK